MLNKIKSEVKKWFSNNKNLLIRVIVVTFIFGIIAHGYCYFNELLSHDSLYEMLGGHEYNVRMLQNGRFMKPIYVRFRGNITLPTYIGFISLFFISLSTFTIIKLLDIKNNVFIAIICGILVTNYSITLTNATYMHDVDAYSIALFCSSLSIYMFKNNKFGYIFGTLLLVITMGFYQAYFSVAIMLLMIVAIKELLSNKDTKEVIINNIKILCFMIISILVWYGIFQLTLKVFNVHVVDIYNKVPTFKDLFNLSELDAVFNNLFNSEKLWFSGRNMHHSWLILGLNIIFILMLVYFIIQIEKIQRITITNVVLVVLVILLMPIGMNIACLMSMGVVHDLMTYSFFLFYVFVIMLADAYVDINKIKETNNDISKILIYVCSFLLLSSNFTYSNEVYLEKNLIDKSTLSMMTRVLDRMETTNGYKAGETKVAFIGTPVGSDITDIRLGFINTGVGTNIPTLITYYDVYKTYFESYLSYPINLLSYDEMYDYTQLQEVKDMSSFPEEGSVAFVDDVMVVKICDVYD